MNDADYKAMQQEVSLLRSQMNTVLLPQALGPDQFFDRMFSAKRGLPPPGGTAMMFDLSVVGGNIHVRKGTFIWWNEMSASSSGSLATADEHTDLEHSGSGWGTGSDQVVYISGAYNATTDSCVPTLSIYSGAYTAVLAMRTLTTFIWIIGTVSAAGTIDQWRRGVIQETRIA